MRFRLYPLRFSFLARESIHFPSGKSSNLLRGAFGTIFRRIACVPHCPGARECPLRVPSWPFVDCPYARMFEPSALDGGPSGFADWPRPFVFRATHLDGGTIMPGAAFHFDLNLFDMRSPAIAYLVLAFSQLAHDGLGPHRGRADLTEVLQLEPAARLYDGNLLSLAPPMEMSLEPRSDPADRVTVRFLTPTELKSGQQITNRPEFGVLAARIRDRVSKLRELYDDGPLEIDFRGFGERAARVRMTRCELRRLDVERRSSRTGRVHPLGGFVGEAEYEGDLTEFIPYLRAAKWTGVGRQTVWGKGEIEL